MINPFLLSTEERLNHWKEFRKNLSEKSEIEQLNMIAQYWSKAPLKNIAYNCDAPNTWLNIWEMIQINDWCRNSVAIGMDWTLRLIGFNPERSVLGMLLDQDISAMMMVVKIDNDWLMNYDWGLLKKYPQTKHRWLRRYKWSGKKYIEF